MMLSQTAAINKYCYNNKINKNNWTKTWIEVCLIPLKPQSAIRQHRLCAKLVK